ncbi:hypothetical protein ACIQAC_02735 [Streptomyces sp. NPDC088387]|uniref:hypothetical protein n=1 Tax=Streptomyces sp. NPDC088387 TaxID=3365859 RepID=UPI0037F35376
MDTSAKVDTSSSDSARLLRVLAVRALVLAALAGLVGASVPAAVFAVAGVVLLLVQSDPERDAEPVGAPAPQSTSSSTSAETGSKRTGRLLIPVRRLE